VHKKFATWDLALAWYTGYHNLNKVVRKPIVDGPFDPCDEMEMELARQFEGYLHIWYVS
jgi:hypothetical protein